MNPLQAIFRQLHLELTLLARGPLKAQKLDGKTSPQKPDSIILTGEISPDPIFYLRRWENSETDDDRLRVLEAMREEIDGQTHSQKPPVMKHTREWRQEVAEAAETCTVRFVAWRFRCSSKTVVACRKEFK